MALEPARLSDFDLRSPLGSGATARVYEAVHRGSGRSVAIKMLAADQGQMGSELRERFAREALTLAGVRSAYINQILGFGFEQGRPFLVLERLVGESLDVVVKRDGALRFSLIAPWVVQLLLGLRECHAGNVIHRDLKPANIFLQAQGDGGYVAKLIDFGVARTVQASNPTGLTSTQHLLGSVGYMAPEQFSDAKGVGPTADLYALGVVIFRCLTGKLPYVAKTFDQVIALKAHSITAAISKQEGAPNIPSLDKFVTRATGRTVEERFQSAREMLDAWQRVIQDAPASAPASVGPASNVSVSELQPSSRPEPPRPRPQHNLTLPLGTSLQSALNSARGATPVAPQTRTLTSSGFDRNPPPTMDAPPPTDDESPDSAFNIPIDYMDEDAFAAESTHNRVVPVAETTRTNFMVPNRGAVVAPSPNSWGPAPSTHPHGGSEPPGPYRPKFTNATLQESPEQVRARFDGNALEGLDDAWGAPPSSPSGHEADDDTPTLPATNLRELLEQERQVSRRPRGSQ